MTFHSNRTYNNTNYDLKVTIEKKKVGVTMHPKLIKRLTDNIDLDEGFNPNGKKMINFSFYKKE